MSEHRIWFNGELVPYEDATVHVLSHVVHYGSSVFEGIRSYETERGPAVFRLREHMRRLEDSAKIHRMEIRHDLDTLCDAVVETIADSGLESCYIRPVVYRGTGSRGVNPLKNSVETAIAVWKWGQYLGPEAVEQGVDVQVASWARNAPNTTPSVAKAGGNYLNAALVKMDAVLSGFSEGIALTTDGYLAEGSGENLFVVRDDVVYTVPGAMSILPGITRDTVMTLAADLGIEVREQAMPREVLYIADEIFFTGTAAEVTPVRTVDHHTIGAGRRGPITEAIQSAYFEAIRSVENPYGWLTYVNEAEGSEASINGRVSETA